MPVGSGDLHNDASKLRRILHAGGGYEVVVRTSSGSQRVLVRELAKHLTDRLDYSFGDQPVPDGSTERSVGVPVVLRPDAPDTVDEIRASVTVQEGPHGPGVTFAFNDGSTEQLRAQSPEPPLDSGARLLEPISVAEVAGIEPILAELWVAVDNHSLSSAQQHQIMAMADLIRAEQLAATPGETERWKIVGVVRGTLKYLVKEAPRDALAWWKLAELLEQINWSTLAGELPL